MATLEQVSAALVGRYAVERLVGEGGMATGFPRSGYQARPSRRAQGAEARARGRARRRTIPLRDQGQANLQHPNLLPLFDSGEVGGLLFYVMPFVQGESLRARFDREKQLPIDEAVRIAVAVGGALDHAHRHGVIHRDRKPENILLQDGQPVVADFGIAPTLEIGTRVPLFGVTPFFISTAFDKNHDVDADGQRFAMVGTTSGLPQVVRIDNWLADYPELRR